MHRGSGEPAARADTGDGLALPGNAPNEMGERVLKTRAARHSLARGDGRPAQRRRPGSLANSRSPRAAFVLSLTPPCFVSNSLGTPAREIVRRHRCNAAAFRFGSLSDASAFIPAFIPAFVPAFVPARAAGIQSVSCRPRTGGRPRPVQASSRRHAPHTTQVTRRPAPRTRAAAFAESFFDLL
ncbi:hypothetical protein Bpla01_58440 [Burkholderia plantarii]|nr:hypothetical protein Bpla01_58440 [Burkholderia plantarii]